MVSRARALFVSVPFFGSLALIAFSLVHLGRWPLLVEQTRQMDIEVDLTSFAGYPVELVPESYRLAVASGLLLLLGLSLLASASFALMTRSAAAVSLWVVVCVLSAAGVDSLVNPVSGVPVEHLIWFVTCGCSTAVLLAMATTERPLSTMSVLLAAVAIAGLAVPIVDAARKPVRLLSAHASASMIWPRAFPAGPEWPSWLWLMGFALCVAGTTLLRIEVRRSALWGVLPMALVLGRFAAASESDWSAVSRAHRGFSLSEGLNRQYPPARHCRAALRLAPVVQVREEEVVLSGTVLGNVADAAGVGRVVGDKLADVKRQFVDLRQQSGDLNSVPVDELNVLAEVGTPLPVMLALASAAATQGFLHLHFVTFRPPTDRLKTYPAVHLHPCVVDVELADDGMTMSSFADWPALLRAADESTAVLRVNAR